MNSTLLITSAGYEHFEHPVIPGVLAASTPFVLNNPPEVFNRHGATFEQECTSFEQPYEQVLNRNIRALIFKARDLGNVGLFLGYALG